MKRRVRIYKAGGEQTSSQQQASDEQIIQVIMQQLTEGASLYDVSTQLLQAGIPQEKTAQLTNYVQSYLEEQNQNNALEVREENEATDEQLDEVPDEGYDWNQGIDSEDDTDNSDQFFTQNIMRMGGMPSKRSYVKSVLNLAKKQAGGIPDDTSTDIPVGGRGERLQSFIGSVKSNANQAILKKQAEQQYNSMMDSYNANMYAQQGGMYPNQDEDPENPMHHFRAYTQGLQNIFSNNQLTNTSSSPKAQEGGAMSPFISQNEIDFYNSKNVNDPYFAKGGESTDIVDIIDESGKVSGQTTLEDAENRNLTHKLRPQTKTTTKTTTTTRPGNTQLNIKAHGNYGPGSPGRYPSLFPRMQGAGPGIRVSGNWLKQVSPGMPVIGNDTRAYVKDVKKNLFGKPKKISVVYSNPFTGPMNQPGAANVVKTQDMVDQQVSSNYPTNNNKLADFFLRTPGLRQLGAKMYPTDYNLAEDTERSLYKGINAQPLKTKKLEQYTQSPGRQFLPDNSSMYNTSGPVNDIDMTEDQDPSQSDAMRYMQESLNVPSYLDYEDATEYAFGGYIPMAQVGANVVSNQNSDTQPSVNRMYYNEDGTPIQNKDFTDFFASNAAATNAAKNQTQEQVVDYKVKNQYDINGQNILDRGNNLVNNVTDTINQVEANKQNNELTEKAANVENQEPIKLAYKKGTYDPNSGLLMPDQQGFNGVIRDGGIIYAEGGSTYMSEEQIKRFLEEGGELEFI